MSPLLSVLFIVPGMNLAGIPPFSGFIGKLGLLTAVVDTGTPLGWAVVVAAVLTSLLTLYAIAKVWNRAFWGTPMTSRDKRTAEEEEEEDVHHGRPMPAVMVAAALALIVFGLVLSAAAGPLYEYTSQAAVTLQDGAYVRALMETRP